MYGSCDVWNRKDVEPKKTIKDIYNILEQMNMKPVILEEINCGNACFSINLEIDGFLGIFSNGKGITYEYALASALAEFMERLQTGQLFHKMYTGEMSGYMADKKVVQMVYHKYFHKYIKDESIEKLCNLYKQYVKMQKFYSVFTSEYQDLPIEFINLICGSNGTCAGNTMYEAIVQGMCELFERYALYQVYFDKSSQMYSTIQGDSLRNLKSFDLLMEIEKKGYCWEVKDLTLNNSIPVVGLLLWSKDRTKYAFSAGSDVDIDIAIQRCITEIFQGIKWDFNFRNYMKSIFHDDNYFCEDDDQAKHEYMKALKNKTGRLPIKFLVTGNVKNDIPDIFSSKKLNNHEVYFYLLNICRSHGWDLFIKDYSFLGFPTYRVFIPGISEVAVTPGDDVCKMIQSEFDFKNALRSEEIRRESLLDIAIQFYRFPKFYNVYNLTKLLGVIVDSEISEQYEKENVMYLLCNGLDIDLRKFLPEFSRNPSTESMKWNAMRMKNLSLKGGTASLRQISKLAKIVLTEEIYDKVFVSEHKLMIPECFHCDSCKLKKHCKYDCWKKVYNQLYEREKAYYEKYENLSDQSTV